MRLADPAIPGDTPSGRAGSPPVEQECRIRERLDPSLDGREFVLQSSTASRVDPDAPTRFSYHEADGVLWGEYSGDTVTEGRFVGVREGERIEVSFVHSLVAGRPDVGGSDVGGPDAGRSVVRGTAASRIERSDAGLRLVEEFEVDGRPQVSVCVEVRRQP